MSSENVAAVRRYIDAFNRRDMESVMADVAPDVQLDEWPEAPGAQSYRGPDGVRQALDDWFEIWEWMQVEIEDIVEVGDRVLFTLHQRARGKESQVEVEIRSHNVYTFEHGRVRRMELFTEREQALAAAGLATSPASEGPAWVRQSTEVIASGDMSAFAELLHPDVVWEHNLGGGSPEEGTYRGRDSVLALYERILEPWEYMRAVVREVRERDGSVLVEGELHSKHRASQVEIVTQYEQTLEIRDGLLVRGAMKLGSFVPAGGGRTQ